MINIRDYITEEQEEVRAQSFVRRDPDKRSAFERLDALQEAFGTLQATINETDIANTSQAWHTCYAKLTQAFIDCARCEESIVG